jgi:ubiquinone/menaquinone biosynthesis C-methylase UbiE
MRRTWDAAARSGDPAAIGKPVPVDEQVEELFSLLGRPARGDGLCLEIGCGNGRMTAELARRWPEVLAVDVSPEMLAQAERLGLANVWFQLVSGTRLDGVSDAIAQTLVCYGVLQHLPRRRLISTYLAEFARTLAPAGEAVVHLPVLREGSRARLWRLLRTSSTAVRGRVSRNFTAHAAYRGARLTQPELDRALRKAGLRVEARAERPSYFGHAANVLLLLVHDP